MLPELLEDPAWLMSRGERAAIEGLLAHVRPRLAIELGTAAGACLRRIAAHSEEVHSFDLYPPEQQPPANATLHTGDSHQLLPRLLTKLARQGRNVDFVLVDGDHTAEGVRRDLEDLLDSWAVARTAILIHDTANEDVRRGVDAVRFAAWPKVAHVELDWIPGQLFAEPALRDELWYGLGLVVVDSARPADVNGPVHEQRYHPAGPLLAVIRQAVLARERGEPGLDDSNRVGGPRALVARLEYELAAERERVAALTAELEPLRIRWQAAESAVQGMKGSVSWRITKPLRTAKHALRERLG